uniref:Uncharacterized protein n=1 Tax=Tanacetum cinerariifolium TaxID=118510 RepID=A0A699QF67_TANCI|nr:hypothetical protein [Tanacetum cinerariifolium]
MVDPVVGTQGSGGCGGVDGGGSGVKCDVVDGHGEEGDGVVDVTVRRWLYGGDEGAGWSGSGCFHRRLSRRGGVIRGGKRRLWRGVVAGGVAWCRRRG